MLLALERTSWETLVPQPLRPEGVEARPEARRGVLPRLLLPAPRPRSRGQQEAMAERAYTSVLANPAGALQPLGAASQGARLDLENEGVRAIRVGFISEPWARSPPLDRGPSTPPSSLESQGACPRRGVSQEPGPALQSAGGGGGTWLVLFCFVFLQVSVTVAQIPSSLLAVNLSL